MNGHFYAAGGAVRDCCLVQAGTVVALGAADVEGTLASAAGAAPPRTVDLRGGCVLPGLHDAHCHVLSVGEALCALELRSCTSLEALAARLSRYAHDHRDLPVLYGRGWDHAHG